MRAYRAGRLEGSGGAARVVDNEADVLCEALQRLLELAEQLKRFEALGCVAYLGRGVRMAGERGGRGWEMGRGKGLGSKG